MSQTDDIQSDYREILQTTEGVHLATLGEGDVPEASYAPCAWYQGSCYLFLSQLSRHCGNLKRDPRVSLMLIEDSSAASNAFARRRVSFSGSVEIVARQADCFADVMAAFHQRFGEIVEVLEELPDFTLFRFRARSGLFIRGFGQAYSLEGEDLERLRHIDPRN